MRRAMLAISMSVLGLSLLVPQVALGQRSVRDGKHAAVNLRLASSTPTAGFEAMSMRGGGTIYVAPRGALTSVDIRTASSVEVRDGTDVVLQLTGSASDRLASLMQKQAIDQLAVFTSGKLTATGSIELDPADGRLVLSGLSSGQADRLTRLLGVDTSGPVVEVVALNSSVAPGGMVAVDVFLSNVENLRAFQMTLKTGGGSSGTMTLNSAEIDSQKLDYVFLGQEQVDVVDQQGGRIAAALMSGGVDVSGKVYLGRYHFSVSDDASGTFAVSVMPAAGESVLLDSSNQMVAFSVDRSAAFITIGGNPRTPTGK